MILNPYSEEVYKIVQAEEMERVRKEIRKLSASIRELIEQGEQSIEECLTHMKEQDSKFDFNVYHLNVFHLNKDVPGDVIKFLAMMCSAAGFHHVTITCDCYSSENGAYRVTYPNAISFKSHR